MVLLILPTALFFGAFFVLPMARLFLVGGSGATGWAAYTAILTDANYFNALLATLGIASATTALTLLISGITGVFLQRHKFPGNAALVAMLTLPLAFPGVVIGFMVIMLAGRQGLIGQVTEWATGERVVFAYSMLGLFMGYVYFSIPRTILTVMAATEKLDPRLEEAARSLGASPWRVVVDVIVPALKPALISAGAICFATAVGAFGTAFTLATRINVLPMVIYTEFTMSANIAMAAALSFTLGALTWLVLALARTAAGSSVAAAG
ncbi:ABC transporter permease [Roseateles toxinivorans]|uniref:Putative spermidine/putrescine transport system permease protein n=1 Tax=Roseateles toxinivorans TaxID=270368 RepID=A0A4R6QGN8_9BURK|nr:ABC transporter permease [Roseateles toxinivorans]TDP61508.1 putative spermidine/putrescine transport system permease protein [Roseateles toxinivorans]